MTEFAVPRDIASGEGAFWKNTRLLPAKTAIEGTGFSMADITAAESRLARFAPFLAKAFPETEKGVIESPLTEAAALREEYNANRGCDIYRLLLKRDGELPVSGSVKARGGIYEVLCHAEEVARANGFLDGNDYGKLSAYKGEFSRYGVQVGSTGNLGLSIGIMSAAVGFRVTVHMSADAKDWKKALLRRQGVNVVEYASDYSGAVARGRELSAADPMSYFVDDENSPRLFLGYAVAALRLKRQLDGMGIAVDSEHPLIVVIPCGVGGAPGGITFGLKCVFGEDAHAFFAEPALSPCMLLGLSSGLHDKISVEDAGLSGRTEADGLAVGRASGFICRCVEHMVSGAFALPDAAMAEHMRLLWAKEGIFAEPSACASLAGVEGLWSREPARRFMERHKKATVIAWLTGGGMVPEEERQSYLSK